MFNTKTGRRLAVLAILLGIIAAFAVVMIPAMLILPFKPQTTDQVQISYLLKRWSPLVTALVTITLAALAVMMWSGARRWWRKTALVLALLVTLFPLWFARQNHFEWMFKPIVQSGYVAASDASFVGDNDMVMGVEINDDKVAYPVRALAYHHVVLDTVGRKPIVATY